MSIKNITFSNGIYTIEYDDKQVIGIIEVEGELKDKEFLTTKNLLTKDIKDSIWLNKDEYIVAITKCFEILPDSIDIPLGKLRFYISNHMDFEPIFSFIVKNSHEIENYDATQIQFDIFRYLDWEF